MCNWLEAGEAAGRGENRSLTIILMSGNGALADPEGWTEDSDVALCEDVKDRNGQGTGHSRGRERGPHRRTEGSHKGM